MSIMDHDPKYAKLRKWREDREAQRLAEARASIGTYLNLIPRMPAVSLEVYKWKPLTDLGIDKAFEFRDAMIEMETSADSSQEEIQEVKQAILDMAKHDGQLNEEDTHHVYCNNFSGVVISTTPEHVVLTAKESLSLLAWLLQEEQALKKLAKLEEGSGQ